MFERGNADRRRARFGVRLLIALLVTALITLGCGSNATDERLVEDRNDVGAPEADDHPDPESARESRAAEEVAADAPLPSLPTGLGAAGPDADDSPPAFLDDTPRPQ